MQTHGCSICASRDIQSEYRSASFSVSLCKSCGHREAEHAPMPEKSDYYEHTPTREKFVSSLLETRKRQADTILDQLVPLLDETDGWLDFGCGRGVFLEQARAHGLEMLAGYETSALSKEWLTQRGFPMAESKAGEAFWANWESIPFAPRIVSLFDVAEHFPGGQALGSVQRITRELPDLQWLVIKVPVSDGILFRLAKALKWLVPGIYRQLFQAGTFPPHFHYFSRRSLDLFMEKAGLEPLIKWDDSDLDNLFHRIPSLDFLPAGRFAARVLGLFPGDTRVVCARIRK